MNFIFESLGNRILIYNSVKSAKSNNLIRKFFWNVNAATYRETAVSYLASAFYRLFFLRSMAQCFT